MSDRQRGVVTALLIALVVSTAVLIYLSNVISVSFDQAFYEKEYRKLSIQDEFNSSVDLSTQTRILIDYLETGDEIESSFYNERERTHLEEVQGIYRAVQRAIDISFVVSLLAIILLFFLVPKVAACMPQKECDEYLKTLIARLLIWTGAIVDGVAVLLAIIAATFSKSFIWFHELFFRTDTWILDPATDNLVRMLPEQFFFDSFIRIIFMSVVFATILLVVGFLIKLGRPTFLKQKR